MVCQRCLLNTMSNRTMLASTDCGTDNHRFISQRQYKRKLRKDCPSYATIERKSMKIKKNGEKSNSKDEDDVDPDAAPSGINHAPQPSPGGRSHDGVQQECLAISIIGVCVMTTPGVSLLMASLPAPLPLPTTKASSRPCNDN